MYLGPIETRKLGKATVAVPRPLRPTLFGHIYETIFDYEGHQFWIGADYYPEVESEGKYLVSYKVGIVDSWFATAFEYTVPLDDIYIECHEDEILNIVRRHIEEKKSYAAKRYLESIYTAMWWWDQPTHKVFLSVFLP